ncbi:MAG: hypothetical protein U1F25_13035 [Rubrivivax sp.]
MGREREPHDRAPARARGAVERLRAASCAAIEMPLTARVVLLMQDYGHFVAEQRCPA